MAEPDDLTCQAFVEMVTAYLEGALSDAERARFEAHIGECDYCLSYSDQIRLTVRVLRRMGTRAMAPVARARLLDGFRDWKREAGSAPVA